MDKNTISGFGLLMLLLVGYILYNQNAETKYQAQVTKDSIENAKKRPPLATKMIDTTSIAMNGIVDSALLVAKEELTTIENNDVIVTLTNKGAFAKKIQLKKFKTYDGKPLFLFDGDKNSIDYGFKSINGNIVHTKAETFTTTVSTDKKSIAFANANMNITYTLEDDGYMMAIKAVPVSADKAASISMDWSAQSLLTEHDLTTQQQFTQLCSNTEKDGVEITDIKDKEIKDIQVPIKWLGFKQHYFNTTLIPDAKIISLAKITTESKADTAAKTLSTMTANMNVQNVSSLDFRMFVGPNDYRLLKTYNKDLEEMIPLSYGIFGFVKYINKWIILPIFYGLSKFFSSFGIVILLLTFILRLLMSPFTYKSYVSSAKMKALKPELDELKEKHGDDKQAYGVDQMKLYREAGVNPLGGCLPALLQLPVFFALLSFFPQSIELRQSKFLWAKDLSTYDSIYDLPFSIPFYGDHISLFTILFVITSLILALYSMNTNMGADQSNPMMKYLPFIMPIMFLGIFNKLSASLTFYYFVSNVITLALQFVIQQWIIDPEKIHAQIKAKRSAPPKENKLMKKMMEMQQQQQQMKKK